MIINLSWSKHYLIGFGEANVEVSKNSGSGTCDEPISIGDGCQMAASMVHTMDEWVAPCIVILYGIE